MLNDKISKTTFVISLSVHCLLLGMPWLNKNVLQLEEFQDITVEIEIEKPPLLPRIDIMGEEKKLEMVVEEPKPLEAEPESQPEEIIPEDILNELIEGKIAETVLKEEKTQPIIEEKIEVLRPDKEATFRYQDMVKQKIESCRRYPNWAKKQGIEGISLLAFTLLSNGMVQDIKLIRSSGFAILDKEAVATVKRACPFCPIPEKFNCFKLAIEVTLVFKLE